eukprot:5482352-Amphidinium_carterae.1
MVGCGRMDFLYRIAVFCPSGMTAVVLGVYTQRGITRFEVAIDATGERIFFRKDEIQLERRNELDAPQAYRHLLSQALLP